jgi:hypothetical protein
MYAYIPTKATAIQAIPVAGISFWPGKGIPGNNARQ